MAGTRGSGKGYTCGLIALFLMSAAVGGCGNGSNCSQDQDCTAGLKCDPNSKTCVACVSDGDCHDRGAPRCEPAAHRCVACLPADDNCQHGMYCQQSADDYACAPGCKSDTDCPPAGYDAGDVGDAGGPGDGGTPPG